MIFHQSILKAYILVRFGLSYSTLCGFDLIHPIFLKVSLSYFALTLNISIFYRFHADVDSSLTEWFRILKRFFTILMGSYRFLRQIYLCLRSRLRNIVLKFFVSRVIFNYHLLLITFAYFWIGNNFIIYWFWWGKVWLNRVLWRIIFVRLLYTVRQQRQLVLFGQKNIISLLI